MTCRNLGASSSFRRLFLRLRLSSDVAPLVWMGVRRDMMDSVLDYLMGWTRELVIYSSMIPARILRKRIAAAFSGLLKRRGQGRGC